MSGTIVMFIGFVVMSLLISYYAAKRTKTKEDFYTAGGKLSGFQNGLAIAGDFISAASFLGVTGLVFLFGFDGLLFGLGAVSAWGVVFFLMAERIRNLGKHTFVDVVTFRFEPRRLRMFSVVTTLFIVVFYLIAQMVGAGKLIQILFGLEYWVALCVIALLVLMYVFFGGMLATTWVQIIKAVLLLGGTTVIVLLVLAEFNFSFEALFTTAVLVHPKSIDILSPGLLYSDWKQVASVLLSMVFGIAGLPHILMRFFTVPDMKQARRSAFWASIFMSFFFLLMVVLGYGSIAMLYQHPELFANGKLIGGSNMTPIHLAGVVGGPMLLAFISAVAFATIIAVVAGLSISGAATVAHDLYAEVIKKGKPDPDFELKLSRFVILIVCLLGIVFGLLFENQNVAITAVFPLVLSANVCFPLLMLTMYWKNFTTRAALVSGIVGLLASFVLIVVGPKVWVDIFHFEEAIIPFDYPTIITLPIVLTVAIVVALLDKSPRATIDREGHAAMVKRSEGL
ncbi:MAG: hypothetical protein QM538_05040 [Methylacidiphilales bacterium]|nr:hypothetical protein [Candidatus Methylacidiphilales bacterium]